MSTAVLVLDVDFQPLRIADWKTVITDSFLGKLEVVEYSKDKTIKGVSRHYPMPSVVRVLRRFRRDRQAIKFSRLNIYARDGFTCLYCGNQFPTEDLTFDHVFPRSRGGKTCWENIATACVSCNTRKADLAPGESGVDENGLPFTVKLLRKPRKPHSLPVITVEMSSRQIPAEWQPYWTAALDR